MRFSILPRVVGFDIRRRGMILLLSPGTTEVEYLTKRGVKAVIRGSRKTIKSVLRNAGYKVVLEKPKKG
jgi:hypothetical protein